MAQSEIEWDVNPSTSRVVEALLAVQFGLVGGTILFAGTSLFLALAARYATERATPVLVGFLVLGIVVPILLFYLVLRAVAGSGIKRVIALYYFYDSAHPERTIFDHAPPRRYVGAATVGLFGYLSTIFLFEFRPDIVYLFVVISIPFCYLLWWSIPNRGHLDIESEALVVYNRRLLTEGGSASARNLLRGFSNDDRQTSLKDVIGMRAIQIGDIVILALRHRSGYAPTLVVVPPRVAERFAQEYGS